MTNSNRDFDKLIDAGSDSLLKAWILSLKNQKENSGFTVRRHSTVTFSTGQKVDIAYQIELSILDYEDEEAADETATL